MTMMRAKQLYFANENQIIIGSSSSNGRYLNPGATGTLLRVTASGLSWSNLDVLKNDTGTQSITTGANDIDLKSGDANLKISSTETALQLTVSGTTAKDLILVPGENGNVIIGGPGDGVIEAEPNEDLSIKGGSGAGNLFLSAGATGKVYYGNDASNPLNEVATLGTVRGDLSSSFQRVQYQGNATLTVPANAITSTIEAYINGVLISVNDYTISNNILEFSEANLGFVLDNLDVVIIIYVGIA